MVPGSFILYYWRRLKLPRVVVSSYSRKTDRLIRILISGLKTIYIYDCASYPGFFNYSGCRGVDNTLSPNPRSRDREPSDEGITIVGPAAIKLGSGLVSHRAVVKQTHAVAV